jgi:diguanylate cyclase (GGDEF)-like protein
VIVAGLSPGEIAHHAEVVRQAVQSSPIAWREEIILLTISLGVSTSGGDDDTSVRALLSRADGALYEAKLGGRNRVGEAAPAKAAVGAAEARKYRRQRNAG